MRTRMHRHRELASAILECSAGNDVAHPSVDIFVDRIRLAHSSNQIHTVAKPKKLRPLETAHAHRQYIRVASCLGGTVAAAVRELGMTPRNTLRGAVVKLRVVDI